VSKYSNDRSIHSNVYFGMVDQSGFAGFALIAAVCDERPHMRNAIVEYHNNDMSTGQVRRYYCI
jgi:hypothetical protein